ncbi:MAG: GNAT family N-acetyltransferase [Phycisphaerales bacterium]|nr:GNAT family N-acetyltransferase [Phycisphaerales bacterium]
MPLDYLDVARLEESRVAAAMAAVAPESRPWGHGAGGFLCRGQPGIWCNVAIGGGLQGPVSDAAAAEVIDFHASQGIEPRVELSPFADDTLRAALQDAGFSVRMFEILMYRELSPAEAIRPDSPLTADARIERVDPRDDRLVDACGEVVVPAFCSPGHTPTHDEFDFFRKNVRQPNVVTVAARLNDGRGPDGRGTVIGVAATDEPRPGAAAGLFGAAVHPHHRRRGVQQALLAFRLNLLAAGGAAIATIGSRPDVATYRNARRMGFQQAYTKVILTRPGPGLRPVVS